MLKREFTGADPQARGGPSVIFQNRAHETMFAGVEVNTLAVLFLQKSRRARLQLP